MLIYGTKHGVPLDWIRGLTGSWTELGFSPEPLQRKLMPGAAQPSILLSLAELWHLPNSGKNILWNGHCTINSTVFVSYGYKWIDNLGKLLSRHKL